MNTLELLENLKKEKVPERIFAINKGYQEDRCCIVMADSHWEVYYGERGEKIHRRTFNNENKACQYFLKWIKKYEIYKTRLIKFVATTFHCC